MEKFDREDFKLNKILILIVNYNLNLNESKTFRYLKKIKEHLKDKYDIFLWDNLYKVENLNIFNEEFKNEDYKYLPSLENETLANIYNLTIEEFKTKYDYFILLDNDSSISIDYFYELEKIIENESHIELILPKVISNNKVFSPQKNFPDKLKKSIFFIDKDFGIKNTLDVMAVNSGMVISTKYLERTNFKYDKRLNFYGTDNYFMHNFRQNSDCFYLMNYRLKHEFSMDTKENLEKVLWRHKDILNGEYILLEEYKGLNRIMYRIKIIKNSILKTFKYKEIEFIKMNLRYRDSKKY